MTPFQSGAHGPWDDRGTHSAIRHASRGKPRAQAVRPPLSNQQVAAIQSRPTMPPTQSATNTTCASAVRAMSRDPLADHRRNHACARSGSRPAADLGRPGASPLRRRTRPPGAAATGDRPGSRWRRPAGRGLPRPAGAGRPSRPGQDSGRRLGPGWPPLWAGACARIGAARPREGRGWSRPTTEASQACRPLVFQGLGACETTLATSHAPRSCRSHAGVSATAQPGGAGADRARCDQSGTPGSPPPAGAIQCQGRLEES